MEVDGAVEAGFKAAVPTAGIHHRGGLYLDELNTWQMSRFAVLVNSPVDVELGVDFILRVGIADIAVVVPLGRSREHSVHLCVAWQLGDPCECDGLALFTFSQPERP